MTNALMGTPWLAVLDRIVKHANDDTTRTLAKMLWDITNEVNDRRVDEILDAYAYKILGSL